MAVLFANNTQLWNVVLHGLRWFEKVSVSGQMGFAERCDLSHFSPSKPFANRKSQLWFS